MSDERKCKPRGRTNIPALEEAGKAALEMSGSPDKDLAHLGEVIERITRKLLLRRTAQAQAQSRKKFYTSADASAKDD